MTSISTRRQQHLKPLATLAALALASASSLCAAQEQPTPVTSASETDANDLNGPQNLPGHPKRNVVEPAKPTTPREWFGELNYFQWTRLTGDWGGARTKLEDAGITIAASFTLDWSTVSSGGITNQASSRDLFDFNVTLDLEKAFKLDGGTIYADFMASDGRGGSADSGDYTGISNIATGANTVQLAELWYQQVFADKKLKAKIGKIEANTDFAYFNCTPDFLNGASAMPATLYPAFPTYPNPATGIDLFFNPTEQFYIGAGVFDGSLITGNQTGRVGPASAFRGDGTLFMGEGGASWKFSGVSGRACIGGWYDTAEIPDFAGNTQKGSGGVYIMGEQQVLTRDGATEDPKKGLFVFGEIGIGDADVNPAATHIGGGLSWLGTIPGRDSDSAGFMVNWIDLSNATGSPFVGDETSFELYYKIQLTPAVSLTPDIQWIKNPSGNSAISDALVAAVRLNLTF